MNIIFATRNNCFSLRGGDTIQLEETKKAIEKIYKDVNINIVTNIKELASIKNIDIIHIFNIQTTSQSLEYVNFAKKNNIKIVLSPIYWNMLSNTYINYLIKFKICPFYIHTNLQKLFIHFINLFVNIIYKYRNKYKLALENGLYLSSKNKKLGRYILNNSDFILPNSDEELKFLSEYFEIDYKDLSYKSLAIPNAVNFNKIKASHNLPKEYEFINNLNNIVIQAGRIEPGKNQLNLVEALKNDIEIPILLIGQIINDDYYNKIKKIMNRRGNIYHIDNISQDILFAIFQKAKVHVLASFRESPGLVSMEAKACGCEIVVSNDKYCPIKYYKFDTIANVCEPFSKTSIRNAILNALNSKKINIDKKYKDFFSYDNVAKMVHDIYLKAVEV